MLQPVSLYLLRRDVRLSDNPALHHAQALGHLIIPLIIVDPKSPVRPRGAAAEAFYQKAVHSFDAQWQGAVRVFQGTLTQALHAIQSVRPLAAVCWNQGATPDERQQDEQWALDCASVTIPAHKAPQASLLWELENIHKPDGTPYKVFTPFYRKGCLEFGEEPRTLFPRVELKAPFWHQCAPELVIGQSCAQAWPQHPSWAKKIMAHWDASETGAKALWGRFVSEASAHYKEGRNRLDTRGTTELSPYLACGLVSPHQLWHAAADLPPSKDREHFCQELGWREFSASLLHHFPALPEKNWDSKFDSFPWEQNYKLLESWQKGQTGIPVVDAGMRQLWETGYMHNRARMIVASFLVKNMLLPWQLGEEWFWDCLVDADLANNSASWQWVAGCGADAAPYFRIFNPILQAQKFDPQGVYTRRYLPELIPLPDKILAAPWEHQAVCAAAGVVLGKDYPYPCVSLKESRDKALKAFQEIKIQSER